MITFSRLKVFKVMNFAGKTIWITGASSGIGEALALEWSKYNTKLIISGRNIEKLNQLKDRCEEAGAECLIIYFDLTNTSSIREAVKKVIDAYSYVDILVNNGGVSQRSEAKETPVEVDRKVMEINFFGAVTLTKEIMPSMIKKRAGHIVVISSVVGKFGFPLRTAYSASKHALQGFFDSLRAELKTENIKVTMISPGRIQTNISINALNKYGAKHGVMDPGQEKGIPVNKCAKKIIRSVYKGRKDVIIAREELLLIFFRKFLPAIYYHLASRVSPT